jgi:hypothetical protein
VRESHPPFRPNLLLRVALTGAGSAITLAAAASAWLQLALLRTARMVQPPPASARLRRGRIG